MHFSSKAAFTLVELAIVIIIIGLLIAGVLMGKDLIEQAKIRAQIKQFAEYDSAMLTYKSKYGCLAGDCRDSTRIIPANGCFFDNGDGDGLIYDTFRNGSNPYPIGMTGEVSWVPYALYYSKIFPVPPDLSNCGVVAPIVSKLNNSGFSGFIVTALESKNGYYFGMDKQFDNTGYGWAIFASSRKGVVTPLQASTIDAKLDDGLPMTGKVKAAYSYGGDNRVHIDGDTRTGCTVNTPAWAYNITNEAVTCRMFVEAAY